MRLLYYECQATFWGDFSIADESGLEAARDTYNRVSAEWDGGRNYGTELSMMLNHRR